MPWLCDLRAGHDGPHQDMPGDDVPTWSDDLERRRVSAFTELLAEHTPYATERSIAGRYPGAISRLIIQCHKCLDGHGGGEFQTTEAWAEHITAELAKAGLRVTTRKPAKMAEQEALL